MIVSIRAAEPLAAHARALELVAARYASEVFLAADSGEADFEVRVTQRGASPVGIEDGLRHLILYHQLLDEFGPHVTWEEAPAGEWSPPLRLRIDREAQKRAFQKFLAELPAFLGSLFPIISPRTETSLRLGQIELLPPQPTAEAVSTRWTVNAELTLVDTAQGATIESGRYPLCNFFGVSEEGEVNEPGRKHRRPFDEIEFDFRRSLRDWVQHRAAERMKSGLSAGKGAIARILELEE